ncbi:MAG TPA: CBS domain-containing protein [Pirellulaceae bacterium]|nr:CBS domain-containing protein [Pirellulaceae bacterium]
MKYVSQTDRRCAIRRGATIVETVSLIAGIAITLAAIGWGIRNSIDAPLHDTMAAFEPSHPAAKDSHRAPQKATIESSGQGTTNVSWQFLLAISIASGMGCCGLFWILQSKGRKSRRGAAIEAEVDQEPLPESLKRCVFSKRQRTLALLNNQLGVVGVGAMQVQHLMSRDVCSVLPTTPIKDVKQLIESRQIRHVLVCDAKGRLCGIISDRDMQRASSGTARDLMTAKPISVTPTNPINTTVTLMMKRRISSVPVVDQEQVVGILTTTDLLIALQCTLQLIYSIGQLTATPNPQ